ncbi:MAG: hypothetical protein ACREXS_17950 [Gammaproteobacteria bacterium]
MNAVEKILDQLPYTDGGIRRRFIGGMIFFVVLLIHWAVYDALGIVPVKNVALLDGLKQIENLQVLAVFGVCIYALGSIIDAMSEGFILRGVSITRRGINWLLDMDRISGGTRDKTRVLSFFTFAVSFCMSPLMVTAGTIMSAAGRNPLHKIGLPGKAEQRINQSPLPDKKTAQADENEPISVEAARYFKQLPESMQAGLDTPFGDQFEAAWQALIAKTPESHRPWVKRLGTRNRDIACFLSAAFLALVLSTAVSAAQMGWNHESILSSYAILCFLGWWLLGCASIVGRSIVSVLELLAVVTYEMRSEE